jgi:hypothetical protein
MSDFMSDFSIYVNGGGIIRLKRGMSKTEVLAILGQPSKTENCKNMSNEKLVFKLASRHLAARSYTILFTRERLVYVVSK